MDLHFLAGVALGVGLTIGAGHLFSPHSAAHIAKNAENFVASLSRAANADAAAVQKEVTALAAKFGIKL